MDSGRHRGTGLLRCGIFVYRQLYRAGIEGWWINRLLQPSGELVQRRIRVRR
jgi:hypothetical protein